MNTHLFGTTGAALWSVVTFFSLNLRVSVIVLKRGEIAKSIPTGMKPGRWLYKSNINI